MIGRRIGIALVVASIAITLPSIAFAWTGMASRWSPTQLPVRYRINETSIPASIGATGGRGAVDAGFASWSAPTCTSWRSMNAGTTALTAGRAGDGENSILWRSGTWPPELGAVGTVIGVTTPVYRTGGSFIDADIQFNNVGFRWSLTGAAGTVDTQSIATHEEGHFLGLGHSALSSAVMFASYPGGVKRTLTADDTMGVCTLYPTGTMTGCTMTSQCATGQQCIMGTCQWVTPDGGTGTAGFGEPCSMTMTCMMGLACGCVAGSCYCSRMCSTSNPCPTGYRCTATASGSYCLRASNGNTGDPCTTGLDCASNICIPGTTGSFCSQVCIDACTCPPDYACSPRSGGGFYCQRGVNDCMPAPDDVPTPPDDTPAPDDTGVPDMDSGAATDAAMTGDTARDGRSDGGNTGMNGGCRCRAAGAVARRSGQASCGIAFAAIAVAIAMGRRRRQRDSARSNST